MRLKTKGSKRFLIGIIFLLFFSLVPLLARYLSPYEPDALDLFNIEAPPSLAHPLGTDALGRDVLSRFFYGGRVSLLVGFLSSLFSVGIGTILGSVAGYYGGKIEIFIMRFTDAMLSFPTTLLALVLSPIFNRYLPDLPSVWRLIIILAGLGWPFTCRLIRGEVLSLKESTFVEASRLMGAREAWIIRKHLFPALLPTVIVSVTFGVANGILAEAVLSYLGVGIRPPTPSWGGMLEEAKDLVTLTSMPWLWMPPGIAIMLVSLSVNWLGEGLQRRTRSY